jgi:hypothetical protein
MVIEKSNMYMGMISEEGTNGKSRKKNNKNK